MKDWKVCSQFTVHDPNGFVSYSDAGLQKCCLGIYLCRLAELFVIIYDAALFKLI